MWVFLNNAFLSIVQHRDDNSQLLVRARIASDIERVFPDAKTFTDNHADYKYRAVIPRAEVAKAMATQVEGINYDNFKNSVHDTSRHDAYLGVWSVMSRTQK